MNDKPELDLSVPVSTRGDRLRVRGILDNHFPLEFEKVIYGDDSWDREEQYLCPCGASFTDRSESRIRSAHLNHVAEELTKP